MKKHYLIWSLLAVLIASVIVCSLVVISLAVGDMRRETLVSTDQGTYSMDSQTILPSLAGGKTDVFVMQRATPNVTPIRLPPVQWKQTDYLQVANAFYQFVWRESFDSWKLERLHFGLECKDVASGPQYASFDLYKTVQTQKGSSRIERTLFVSPNENQVSWNDAEYYPDIEGKLPFDLAQVKVPAEKALQTAETHGGQQARVAVNNVCNISISVVAGVRDNNWQVWYSGNLSDLFIVNIDKQTGEYQIIYPKPK